MAFVLSWCEVAEDWTILPGKLCYSAYIGISRILYRSHNGEQSIQSQRHLLCLCLAFTACTYSTTWQLPLLQPQRQMAQSSASQAPMSSATPQCAFWWYCLVDWYKDRDLLLGPACPGTCKAAPIPAEACTRAAGSEVPPAEHACIGFDKFGGVCRGRSCCLRSRCRRCSLGFSSTAQPLPTYCINGIATCVGRELNLQVQKGWRSTLTTSWKARKRFCSLKSSSSQCRVQSEWLSHWGKRREARRWTCYKGYRWWPTYPLAVKTHKQCNSNNDEKFSGRSSHAVISKQLVKLYSLIRYSLLGILGSESLKPIFHCFGAVSFYHVVWFVAKLLESNLHCWKRSAVWMRQDLEQNKHIVSVREKSKARTCISTGRGEIEATSSMSLRPFAGILDGQMIGLYRCEWFVNLRFWSV